MSRFRRRTSPEERLRARACVRLFAKQYVARIGYPLPNAIIASRLVDETPERSFFSRRDRTLSSEARH